ncbi:MAG TPA: hypothetical protein VES95_00025 [Dermatophilaceae bacterium]|nr:hypothetical protein [Dermatophilaceae bacterium]
MIRDRYAVDADFAAWAGARQRSLVGTAYLLTVDHDAAHAAVLEALAAVAARWRPDAEERPDNLVRRHLHAAAGRSPARADVAPPGAGPHLGPEDASPSGRGAAADPSWGVAADPSWEVAADPSWEVAADPVRGTSAEPSGDAVPDPEEERRERLRRALRALSPEERSALVLLVHEGRPLEEAPEVLGRSVRRTRHAAERAGAALASVTAPDVDPDRLRHDLADLADLADRAGLADVGAAAPAPDLVTAAWGLARERARHRRRWLAAGAALVAVLAVAVAGVRAALPDPEPVTVGWRPVTTVVDGVDVVAGPTPAAEARLPLYPDGEARLGLPTRLGFEANARIPRLTVDTAGSATVRAVLLRQVGPAAFRPVLYRPDAADPYVEADTVLREPSDSFGRTGLALDPRSVADDHRQVVFAQSGAVVLLDGATGAVRRIAVPDPFLTSAGFTAGSEFVIASSGREQWRVDVGRGTAQRLGDEGHPGSALLRASPGGSQVVVLTADGTPAGTRSGPRIVEGTVGGSVTDAEGWLGSGVRLASDPALAGAAAAGRAATGPAVARGASQGVLAAQVATLSPVRVLAAPDAPGRPSGCCTALGWGTQQLLLLRSDGAGTSRLLAWDVRSGALQRVSELPVESREEGAPAAQVALAP